MPFSTIDPLNPFVLDKTKAVKTATSVGLTQSTLPVKPANNLTVRSAMAAQGDATANPATSLPKPRFEITTEQMIKLIMRFRLRSMTFQQLKNLPLSQLNQVEKDFVLYLRRNPGMFARISNNKPAITVEDIQVVSQIAKNPQVLTDQDLQALQATPLEPLQYQPAPDAFLANAQNLKIQDLIDTLYQIGPQGLTFDQLMNLQAEELALQEKELQSLRFLQSPTISKVLEKLVTPYDNQLSPEVLRVLSSLVWNPAVVGTTPIVFFQTAPLAQETEIDPVTQISPTGGSRITRIKKRSRGTRVEHPKQVVHLEAQPIIDICHRLNPNGQVSLDELRHYAPQTDAEEKALKLLRQAHIFQAIAGLQDDPDYLSEADVKLALAEGALVLSKPFIVVVVEP